MKPISNFGGDPDKITTMGTSDRAAMIDLLLVAKGGHEVLPFNQAMFDGILRAANCTTVACLRDAPQEVLFKANSFLINEVGDGSTGALGPLTGFTPVVDGKYIEDLPTALLARGSYNRKVKRVVVGTWPMRERECH
ncbi:hypothetical protein RJZ56_004290 [Blastomyces dermatitidis]